MTNSVLCKVYIDPLVKLCIVNAEFKMFYLRYLIYLASGGKIIS